VPLPAIFFVVAIAVLALLALITTWAANSPASLVELAVAAVAVIVAGSRTIRVSDLAGTVSVGSIVVLASILHLGTPEACVVAALGGLAAIALSRELHERSWTVLVFAAASLVVTAWVAGETFRAAAGRTGELTIEGLAVPAFITATAYYVVNAALVTTASRLSSGERWRTLLSEWTGPTVLAHYSGACLAVLLHIAWRLSGPWVLIAALPIVYAIHLSLARRLVAVPSPAPTES
jgi:hypothetical protein